MRSINSAKKTAKKVIDICKQLHNKNLLAACDGNVSIKTHTRNILITPTGVHKAYLKISELAIMTENGKILKGSPSSERLMHLEVYRSCPKAKAIIHAHPPIATAWSIIKSKELPSDCISETILAVGKIPIAPYARPGTEQMGICIRSYLPIHRVIILARHGALCWGESLEEAYMGVERLEHAAKILWIASTLGNLTSLPKKEIQALMKIRSKMGEKIL
ncbi:MAG: class II aldolase/adducin family protein [Deltaproteobacteria bacterium]|nr:class II aldolase/adducin family protein [Deltaproteobacteria bacterium]